MSALKRRLIDRISKSGAISVAEYMTLCLLDPVDGFYPTRDPLGSDGDFITAPEISQMFGELIGIWCIQSWKNMGSPEKFNLVEMGPGRGIMMSDILRSIQMDPACAKAVRVQLIEASAALQAVQADSLKNASAPVAWINALNELDEAPTLIIGNEFLDCLPVRQFIQRDRFAGPSGWHERLVTVEGGELQFATSAVAISNSVQAGLPKAHAQAKTEDLLEINLSIQQVLEAIAAHFSGKPGRALFIDYGPERTEFGDSLQALKRHKKVGVFSDPGNTDLTARVDFEALSDYARQIGLSVAGPVIQSEFLSKLGLEIRAMALARAKPDAKAKIGRQLHRLTDEDEMGTLFKAICLQSPGLGIPLGFRGMA